jgi:hypothetical protein
MIINDYNIHHQLTSPKISKNSTQWKNMFSLYLSPEIPKIYLTRNPTVENNYSCFSHHSSGHLISLLST